jgi:hypothetical protein
MLSHGLSMVPNTHAEQLFLVDGFEPPDTAEQIAKLKQS